MLGKIGPTDLGYVINYPKDEPGQVLKRPKV